MGRLLVVEDEWKLAETIGHDLIAACGFRIEYVACPDLMRRAPRGGFDLLLGFDDPAFLACLDELRWWGLVQPVFVLAATSPLADARIVALRAGADDALSHPYLIDELALRVARLTRSAPPSGRRFEAGGLVIDRIERRVWRDGREIFLLPREFALLMCLARNHGCVLGRRALLAAVWKLRFDPGTNVVDVHISRLRAKLDRGFGHPLIETVKGVGYRLASIAENAPTVPQMPFGQVTAASHRVG